MLPIFLNSPFRMAVSMACRRTGDSPAEAAVAVAQPSSPCRGLRDGGASWALVEMAGAKRRKPQRSNKHTRIRFMRSEEHTSELQSRLQLVCPLLLVKKKLIKT